MEGVTSSSEAAAFAVGKYAILTDVAVCSEASFAHVALFVLEEFTKNTFFALKFGNIRLSRGGVCK